MVIHTSVLLFFMLLICVSIIYVCRNCYYFISNEIIWTFFCQSYLGNHFLYVDFTDEERQIVNTAHV